MACHSCVKTGQYPSTDRGYSAPSPLGHRWAEWMGSWWVAFHCWRRFSRSIRLVGLRWHAQKVGDRTREGCADVDIIHQCLHCRMQCGPGQRFAFILSFSIPTSGLFPEGGRLVQRTCGSERDIRFVSDLTVGYASTPVKVRAYPQLRWGHTCQSFSS